MNPNKIFVMIALFFLFPKAQPIEKDAWPEKETVGGIDSSIQIYSFLPQERNNKCLTTILMLTGGDGARMVGKIWPSHYEFARRMNDFGYAVFGIDYRNRDRIFMDKRWVRDIGIGLNAVRRKKLVDTGNIFIVGFSIGGTNALRYAGGRNDIRGVVCYGSPISFKKSDSMEMLNETDMPVNCGSAFHFPILFIQGKEDVVTYRKTSIEFIDSLKKHNVDVEYIEYDGVKHGFTYSGIKNQRVEYNGAAANDSYEKVNQFIKKKLIKP